MIYKNYSKPGPVLSEFAALMFRWGDVNSEGERERDRERETERDRERQRETEMVVPRNKKLCRWVLHKDVQTIIISS